MAATLYNSTPGYDHLFFDIYNDGTSPTLPKPPTAPTPIIAGGPCNFVDLSHGPNGVKCGCRRFWDRRAGVTGGLGSSFSAGADQTGWCMCAHHACFHDDANSTQPVNTPAPVAQPAPPVAPTHSAEQENEKPRLLREPLSPVLESNFNQAPSHLGHMMMDSAALNMQHVSAYLQQEAPSRPRTAAISVAAPASEDSMPATLGWVNNTPSQAGRLSLPPLPSQCLLPSQTASSTSSRYYKPFGGTGMNTIAVPYQHSIVQHTSAQAVPSHGINIGTRTSRAGTPTDVLRAVVPTHVTPAYAHAQTAKHDSVMSEDHHRDAIHNLSEALSGHAQRLERLETTSFSVAGHDECHDKHDSSDLRLTDLEVRMEEVEKKLADDTASVATSRVIVDDDATVSNLSTKSTDTARAVLRADMLSQMQALQTRIHQLEALSPPTYAAPWEVEVVFLPFPLTGIWMPFPEFATPAGRGGWTQEPNTNSRATPDPQSTASAEWVGQNSDWLLPRACAPGREIDQRLRSRGFIQTVLVRGSDARSVHLAIANAFDRLLMPVSEASKSRNRTYPTATLSTAAQYLGLQQSWVPLRKVHKDSRLRFLTPAELLTPVLWDVAFLRNSIVMKATGVHRLYVTQPEAYLQHHQEVGSQFDTRLWSWQKIRELDRFYSESQSSIGTNAEVPEADARETCWSWNARLDSGPVHATAQVTVQEPREKRLLRSRTSNGSSDQSFFTGPSDPIPSPVLSRVERTSFEKQRGGSRPPQLRTVSVPPEGMETIFSPGTGGRRVVSYTHVTRGPPSQRHSSPFASSLHSSRVAGFPSTAIGKPYRRDARSPSLRQSAYPTPLMSNKAMTRSPSAAPGNSFSRLFADAGNGVSPFVYATPHSNAVPEPRPRPVSRSMVIYEDRDVHNLDDSDRGSQTDEEGDSHMVDDMPGYRGREHHDDEDDGAEASCESDDDVGANMHRSHGQFRPSRPPTTTHVVHSSSPHGRLERAVFPQIGGEDEPWQGIEDNENIDPYSIDVDNVHDSGQDEDVAGAEAQIVARAGSSDSGPPPEYSSRPAPWLDSQVRAVREDTVDMDREISIFEDDDVVAGHS